MNLATHLNECLSKERKQILVVGDAITDVWIHGAAGISQDGCLKLTESHRVSTPGGAANARACLRNWNVTSTLIAHPDNERPIKYRFVNALGSILFRHDDETMLKPEEHYAWIRAYAAHNLESCHAVLISDYDKRFLTEEFIRKIVTTCNRRRIPCVADCKRAGDLYAGCTIKANAQFFAETENLDFSLVQSHDRGLVMTRGMATPLVYDTSSVLRGCRSMTAPTHLPELPPVTCINHVGAGDCFAAHLTLALSCGFSLKDASLLAHSAGRVYVQHPHNRPPTPDEITADLSNLNTP